MGKSEVKPEHSQRNRWKHTREVLRELGLEEGRRRRCLALEISPDVIERLYRRDSTTYQEMPPKAAVAQQARYAGMSISAWRDVLNKDLYADEDLETPEVALAYTEAEAAQGSRLLKALRRLPEDERGPAIDTFERCTQLDPVYRTMILSYANTVLERAETTGSSV